MRLTAAPVFTKALKRQEEAVASGVLRCDLGGARRIQTAFVY